MSDSARQLPARPSLEQLHKQAKERLRQRRAAGESHFTLAAAQFALAHEYGFANWAELKHHIQNPRPPVLEQFERLARELAAAYTTGDPAAVRELNSNYGTSFGWDRESPQPLPADLALAAAQTRVAHSYGFASWAEFAAGRAAPPFYTVDWRDNRISVRGPQSDADWEALFAVMREHRIAKLSAGAMTDAALQRLTALTHVTHLHVGGSKALTDAGLPFLAHMPQLEDLELGGATSPITDRGLSVLTQLTNLKRFQSCWTPGISDAGAAHLASCDLLESVNLLGTPTGDGVLQGLAGKRFLRRLHTGRNVTDRGLQLLQQFPIFRTWQGGEIRYQLMSPDPEPNHLLIDGPFTNAGLASLAGLDGLFGLTFFWHCPAFTSAGLEPLRDLPNLGFLGCQGQHCDDQAMRHIAALPRLRMLMGQGAVASDDGFAALSRSQTLEYLWGRECPNLSGPGFTALAAMPFLRGLAVSCRKVEDASLSALPRFPALREFMPMDVPDAGFRHAGRCENLEALWCMYCRDTGDAATSHIAGLSRLKTYYAGQTRITDRSLEWLGRMASIERLEFWQCAVITNTGVAHLAGLERLRVIGLHGLPGVTRAAIALFPESVRVSYSG